VICRVFSLS